MSLRDTIQAVREKLTNKGMNTVVKKTHNRRHAIVRSSKDYYVLFKREFFKSFGKMFNEKGIGETINLGAFETAKTCSEILFGHPGKIYSITPTLLRKTGHVWTQKNGEKVISTNVKNLTRWNA